jgi:hypothetical protein
VGQTLPVDDSIFCGKIDHVPEMPQASQRRQRAPLLECRRKHTHRPGDYSNIEPFKFSTQSKMHLVQRLIVAVEQQKGSWPTEWQVLTHEMQHYEYEISARGHISYNAPSGFHDDCVIALANHRCWQAESCGPMLPLPPAGRSPFAKRPRSLFG